MSQPNRHQLTIKQHVFPKASITRFVNSNGFVNVACLDGRKGFKKPAHRMFLSGRAWEQRSEISTHAAERNFQSLATEIVGNSVNSLDENQNKIVAEMMCIWLSRWWLKHNPSQGINLNMTPREMPDAKVPQGYNSRDDYRDAVEKAGLITEGADGTIPARFQSWPRFRKKAAQLQAQLDDLPWGIIRSKTAEFIVPDHSLDGILPVSPTVLLVAGKPDLTASSDDVAELNRRMKVGCKEWYFCRSLEECPFPSS